MPQTDVQCSTCRWKKEAPIGPGPLLVLQCDCPCMIHERVSYRRQAERQQCPEYVREPGAEG
jgi:hypothetical protein